MKRLWLLKHPKYKRSEPKVDNEKTQGCEARGVQYALPLLAFDTR